MPRLMLLVALIMAAHSASAEEHRVTNGGIYGGLSYFSALPDSTLSDFLYPDVGFAFDRKRHFADIGSAFPVLLPDLILSAIRFLGGTDALPPLWDGLNGGEENPGRMVILHGNYRYAFFNNGPHKFDAGGLFDAWWMSPQVAGVNFGNITWNLAPTIGYGFASDAFSINVAAEAGNGFANAGTFNPFLGLQALARVRLGKWVGLYARFHVRHQSFDYSNHESYDVTNTPPEVFDVRRSETMFTADAGVIFTVGRSPRW